MQDFLNKKILVGITGGIAAYKSAYLVRELTRLGASVRVVMTKAAQEFITPMTLQALSGNEVRCDLFDSQAERAMGHIELARWADVVVIAPATANFLAKMAQGIADDLLSTLILVANVPVMVCPAMNHSMWEHPATVAHCELLKSRKIHFVGPQKGAQACGEYGWGRMSEAQAIVNALRLIDLTSLLAGKKVMITAGPTHEAIDPVRYITNRSSGKMGYALAEAALSASAEVLLVTGPTSLPVPEGSSCIHVETAVEMCNAVMKHLERGMIFIGAAAVADYKVINTVSEKIKRYQCSSMRLELEANPDILTNVVESGKAGYTVGFAAETHDLLKHSQEKLNRKNVNMVIGNQVGQGIGFDVDENQVLVLTKDEHIELPLNHKLRIAGQLIAIIAKNIQNTAHPSCH